MYHVQYFIFYFRGSVTSRRIKSILPQAVKQLQKKHAHIIIHIVLQNSLEYCLANLRLTHERIAFHNIADMHEFYRITISHTIYCFDHK